MPETTTKPCRPLPIFGPRDTAGGFCLRVLYYMDSYRTLYGSSAEVEELFLNPLLLSFEAWCLSYCFVCLCFFETAKNLLQNPAVLFVYV